MSNIVGIIPARGGSVGVPLKNIKKLNGLPLIEYTIKAALDSGALDRIIVSTDHKGIAEVSLKCGAEVPFVRPADISEDVDTEYVLQHAIKFLENDGYVIEAVVLLQPTSPFRKPETIKKCVDLYKNEPNADSVLTVNNVEGHRPEWMMSLDNNNKISPYASPFIHNGKSIIRLSARQSFPNLYKMNGSVWVTSRDLLMNHCLVVGPNAFSVVTEDIEAVDIDTPIDFIISDALMKNIIH
jgi:CMP-N,N'-diacetyllegionaminic acid synthase